MTCPLNKQPIRVQLIKKPPELLPYTQPTDEARHNYASLRNTVRDMLPNVEVGQALLLQCEGITPTYISNMVRQLVYKEPLLARLSITVRKAEGNGIYIYVTGKR